MPFTPKVVVFDLDETLGYFSQLGLFWEILKKHLQRDLHQKDFNELLDLYPEYIRPNLISLLNFLKYKKQKNICNGIMIYTNNQGPREWVTLIKNYFDNRLKYSLFDQIVAAFKVNGKVLEIGRTTHDKCIGDFMHCTKLPENTRICFLDDVYHPGMTGENVYYINLKPYIHHLSLDDIISKFSKSSYANSLFHDGDDLEYLVKQLRDEIENSSFHYIQKSKDEYEIDKIVTKKIMIMLQDFFNNKTNTLHKKSLKNGTFNKRNKTLKKDSIS